MPENFTAAMATVSAIVMGANYISTLKMFGCCGIPILTGPPGSCNSEASKCGLSVFGAHELHTCNSQTTPSYLLKTASKTTIPICVDDVSEKAADAWKKCSLMPTMVPEGALECMEFKHSKRFLLCQSIGM